MNTIIVIQAGVNSYRECYFKLCSLLVYKVPIHFKENIVQIKSSSSHFIIMSFKLEYPNLRSVQLQYVVVSMLGFLQINRIKPTPNEQEKTDTCIF